MHIIVKRICRFIIVITRLKRGTILATKHFSSIMEISSCFRFQAYKPYGRLGIGVANPRFATGIRRSGQSWNGDRASRTRYRGLCTMKHETRIGCKPDTSWIAVGNDLSKQDPADEDAFHRYGANSLWMENLQL